MHPYAQLFIYFDIKTLLLFSECKQSMALLQNDFFFKMLLKAFRFYNLFVFSSDWFGDLLTHLIPETVYLMFGLNL